MAAPIMESCKCCKAHVNCCSCWTKSNLEWTKSLIDVPKFLPMTWASWLEKGGKSSCGEKSWKFYKESYVHDVYISSAKHVATGENIFCARARCFRSLKKNEPPHWIFLRFSAQIQNSKHAEISKAHCSCKAGSGGHCNHVFALLFVFNDFSCTQTKEIPCDQTCTSLPQSWNIPRAASVCPMPVMGTHYARSATDREGSRKRGPVQSKLYDARAPTCCQGINNSVVMDQVDHLSSLKKKPPFSYSLQDQESSTSVNTVFGNVPLGSCLSYQLSDMGRPGTKFFINRDITKFICDKCKGFPDIPVLENCERPNTAYMYTNMIPTHLIDYFQKQIYIQLPEAHELEKKTVLQSESDLWLSEHKKRLTASNFGKVMFRQQRPSEEMLKNIFCNKNLSNVKSIAHGKQNEKVVRSIYSNKLQKKIPGFTVFDGGILVSPEFPYIGASPDGKVFDPTEKQSYGLLEIKCPFSKRNETTEQAVSDKQFYMEKSHGYYHLKPDHKAGYFCQVQGQLAISGLTWCDFCVYFSNTNEMIVERIYFDKKYWTEQLLPKLKHFYFNHALQFIAGSK